MEIRITPQHKEVIERMIASGGYLTASEVTRDALQLFEDQERFREMKLEDLRRELQIGIDQLERGESIEWNEETIKQIKQEGMRMLEEHKAELF